MHLAALYVLYLKGGESFSWRAKVRLEFKEHASY